MTKWDIESWDKASKGIDDLHGSLVEHVGTQLEYTAIRHTSMSQVDWAVNEAVDGVSQEIAKLLVSVRGRITADSERAAATAQGYRRAKEMAEMLAELVGDE